MIRLPEPLAWLWSRLTIAAVVTALFALETLGLTGDMGAIAVGAGA